MSYRNMEDPEEREAREEMEAEARLEFESERDSSMDLGREMEERGNAEVYEDPTDMLPLTLVSKQPVNINTVVVVPKPTKKVIATWTATTGWVYARTGLKCCGCPSMAQMRCEDCDCHIDYYNESRAEMAYDRSSRMEPNFGD